MVVTRVQARAEFFSMEDCYQHMWPDSACRVIRLPIILRDDTGIIPVAVPFTIFGDITPLSEGELEKMRQQILDGDGDMSKFLSTLNMYLSDISVWTLCPTIWMCMSDIELHMSWVEHPVDVIGLLSTHLVFGPLATPFHQGLALPISARPSEFRKTDR